jgi:asparagine synthase (glutamine-hydrolysing)
VVERMLAASPHRGTEIQVATHGAWSLGVANPTEPDAWREASVASTSRLAVCWVGALDNAADLSAELARRRGPPGGDTPAELVLAGWETFGEGLPARLRGVFAAVVSDGQRAWCFRDQIGLRPLFYRAHGRAAFIGSEARQVAAGAGLPREADLDVVERIVFKDIDNDAPAAIKGVARLPKATLLRVERDRAERKAYWDPRDDLETARLTAGEVAERFDELMMQAAARCRSVRQPRASGPLRPATPGDRHGVSKPADGGRERVHHDRR